MDQKKQMPVILCASPKQIAQLRDRARTSG